MLRGLFRTIDCADLTLAIGHEWLAGSPYGPPLAYWVAEVAFTLAGDHIVGLYILSQLCVVVAYWAVFALGRRVVGAAHAAMAILLMTGTLNVRRQAEADRAGGEPAGAKVSDGR